TESPTYSSESASTPCPTTRCTTASIQVGSSPCHRNRLPSYPPSEFVANACRNQVKTRLDKCRSDLVILEIVAAEIGIGVIDAENPVVVDRVVDARSDGPADIAAIQRS